MDNKKDISINVGAGVPKSDIQLNAHDSIADDIDLESIVNRKVLHYDINDKFILNDVNNKTHWNKPFFKGLSRALGMFKLSPPKVRLFHLKEELQVEDYNKFLALVGGGEDDPSITNLYLDKLFYNGEFIILATYNEVWYILPDQK